jgi:outer membrane protein assembly factor BamD (BamD/ComL family)
VPDVRESASSLAEEVARLDAARAASKRGAYDEAVRLVASYQHDFPHGALAPDADVIAIEAVARQGDQANLERLCTRFLRLYPADPHAARVRSLSAQ